MDMEEVEETEESINKSCSTSTSTSSASVRGKRHCTEMHSEKPVYLRQKGIIRCLSTLLYEHDTFLKSNSTRWMID
ncbi:hypothetical protein ANTPLA_LOCUS4995 [Anthophora plagiata]